MYLNFHTIVDLIINTLKNAFLFDEVKISQTKIKNEKIKIWFLADNEQDTKYVVEIYTTKEDKQIKIKFTSLDIIKRTDDALFPVVISSYTTNGLINTETTLRNCLSGIWFFDDELEEVK